uniref:Uncharacterized protein n=1 Tax=uncultured Nocardioidaceae bacterium TaxID=253824 RepID=A0A6J4MD21_9ACTN|nr:MAG: hypothetical protein AVDCRST_MAG46-2991 [uncultured Nocardioidaceae bacterium]
MVGRCAVMGVRAVAMLSALSAGAACSSPEAETAGSAPNPVMAVRDWNAYPTAQISGRLRLLENCLLIDDSVVFWADGTSWDSETRSVVFESADPVRIGDHFTGGGGHYAKDSLDGLDGVDVDAVIECLNRTDSSDAVIATPPD